MSTLSRRRRPMRQDAVIQVTEQQQASNPIMESLPLTPDTSLSTLKLSSKDTLTKLRIQVGIYDTPTYLTSGWEAAMTLFNLVGAQLNITVHRFLHGYTPTYFQPNILQNGLCSKVGLKTGKEKSLDLECWFMGLGHCAGHLTILPPDDNGEQPVACQVHRGMIEAIALEYGELEYK